MAVQETKNAIIESSTLGPESHGIFSAYLHLNYGGSGQSFGGYALDKHNGERDARSTRLGTEYGMEFIRRVLITVGVESWEKLKGQHIRVRADYGKVYAIGHFIEDKWFEPEADLAHYYPTK